jgi:hypothetical protein
MMAFWRFILMWFRLQKNYNMPAINDEGLNEYCCPEKCFCLGPVDRDVVDGVACKKCLSFAECYCKCKTWMRSEYIVNKKYYEDREK